VLKRVIVLRECLAGVEGRVEICQLDLAQVLPSERGQLAETGERVEGVAADQEVVGRTVPADLANGIDVVKEPNLSNPVVRGVEPLVGAVVVGQ